MVYSNEDYVPTIHVLHCVEPIQAVIQRLTSEGPESLDKRKRLFRDSSFSGSPTIDQLKTLIAVHYGYLHSEGRLSDALKPPDHSNLPQLADIGEKYKVGEKVKWKGMVCTVVGYKSDAVECTKLILQQKSGKLTAEAPDKVVKNKTGQAAVQHELHVMRHIAGAVVPACEQFLADLPDPGTEDHATTAYRDYRNEALRMFEFAIGYKGDAQSFALGQPNSQFEVFQSFEGGVRHAEYADKKLTQLIDTQLTNGEVYVLVHSRVQVAHAMHELNEKAVKAVQHAKLAGRAKKGSARVGGKETRPEMPPHYYYARAVNLFMEADAGVSLNAFCHAHRARLDDADASTATMDTWFDTLSPALRAYLEGPGAASGELCAVSEVRAEMTAIGTDTGGMFPKNPFCFEEERWRETTKDVSTASKKRSASTEAASVEVLEDVYYEQVQQQAGAHSAERSRLALADRYWRSARVAQRREFLAKWFASPQELSSSNHGLERSSVVDWVDLCQQLAAHKSYIAMRGVVVPEPIHFLLGLSMGTAIYSSLSGWQKVLFSLVCGLLAMVVLHGLVPLHLDALRLILHSQGWHADPSDQEGLMEDKGLAAVVCPRPKLRAGTKGTPLKAWRKLSWLFHVHTRVVLASHLLGLACGGAMCVTIALTIHALTYVEASLGLWPVPSWVAMGLTFLVPVAAAAACAFAMAAVHGAVRSKSVRSYL